MDLKELIVELAKLKKDDVIAALKADAHPIFHGIFQEGIGNAKASHTTKIGEKDAEIATLKTEATASKSKIEELSKEKPDLDAINKRHATEKKKLEGERDEAKTGLASYKRETKSKTFVDATLSFLRKKHKLNADYDDTFRVKFGQRVKVSEDGKDTVSVMDSDDLAELQAGSGKLHELFAKDVLASIPKSFLGTNVDGGAGGADDDPKGGDKTGTDWKQYRERGKKQSGPGDQQKKLKEKFGR